MTEEKVLITSALPYIHGMPHLGNVIGSVLPADVYHRFQNLKGNENIYICASDSHGTMYEIEAENRGVSTEEFVYNQHEKVQELFKKLNLDFTYYGITDSDSNREITNRIFHKLDENDYLKESKMEVTYCGNCDRFLADRWVEGECPECGGLARGDQCDDCGVLLDPKDIIEPYCTHCGKKEIEFRKSNHLFFQLQEFQDWLEEWREGRCKTKVTRNETDSWLNEGLEERCISRDAEWGFPIPREGFEDKVFYVWFDAPIGYIGATADWAKENNEDWEDWWFNDDVEYVQFMGKDNILFHTILFPAMLKGTGENWKLADDVVASAFLMAKDVKFSKSRGKGINLESALEVFDSKYWRFVLMSLYPRDNDLTFSLDILRDKVNKGLNDSFGNFVHRTLKFIQDNFDGQVPSVEVKEEDVLEEIRELIDGIEEHYSNYEFKLASEKILKLSSLGNEYFQKRKPWELVESDKDEAREVLKICANIVKSLAIVAEPVIPTVSERIWSFLDIGSNVHEEDWDRSKEIELSGKGIQEPDPLFDKIEDDEFEDIKQRFEQEEENKKEKNGGEENMIGFDEFQELDLRIGEIKEVEEIEGSDNLFKMQVDVGDETKQSVGGFKGYYSQEEMKGRKVPVLVNLEPSELMGVKSECMVLAAVMDGDEPVFLEPEKDLEAGTGVA